MLVCHLAPDEQGRVVLWAEDSTLPPQHSPKPGRPPNVPGSRDHPFAASIETLQSACSDLNLSVAAETVEHTSQTLLLPSGRFGPEPSPDVVRDEGMDAPVDRVSPWTVPALECDASVLGDVLDAIVNEEASIVPGDTVRYWQTVASLAGELVRGGRVLPHLALREDSGVAVWRALPSTAEDFSRLQSLRESMPPLARALVTDDVANRAEATNSWGDADVQSARDVLVRLLDVCVDTAVRDRLTSAGTDDAVGEPADVHEQWLAALSHPDGTIDADLDALEELRQQLDEWTRPLETTGEQGVRLCLRLWAPEPESDSNPDADADVVNTQAVTDDIAAVSPDGWELELLLQAADDPSLLVEASTV